MTNQRETPRQPKRYRPRVGDIVRINVLRLGEVEGVITAKASAWGKWMVRPKLQQHSHPYRRDGEYIVDTAAMTLLGRAVRRG